MGIARILLFLLAAGVLTGCAGLFNGSGGAVTFDGQRFRGTAKSVDRADRRLFLASVRPVSASEAGAREALRYEGTRYCIRWFGTSDIVWDVEPDAETLPIVGDKLVINGKCAE